MPTSKPDKTKPALWDLIEVWISGHPVLSKHFKVVGSGESTCGLNHGIYYKCEPLKGRFDSAADILENAVEVIDKKYSAADPGLWEILERQLLLMHDRSSEYSVVTFGDPCVKLHPCPKNKPFCGC